MNKHLHAFISFKLINHTIKRVINWNYVPVEPLEYSRIPAEIDLYNSKISCNITLNDIEFFTLNFCGSNIEITEFTIQYNGLEYAVDVTKHEIIFISNCLDYNERHGKLSDKPKSRTILFALRHAVLYLIPHNDYDRGNYLVFSGADNAHFETTLPYNGKIFSFLSQENSDLLKVSSDREFTENDAILIRLAFSLFQNAEIALLEFHTEKEFQLYIQLPPVPGTRLCKDNKIFNLIWEWLSTSDEQLSRIRNTLEFFFAGTRNYGSYIDFRLINLFICMDSIRNEGKGTKPFGVRISNYFGISEGDGYWLAYIRHHMVHEGATIVEAINGALVDFYNNQVRRGFSLSHYAVYDTATDKSSLPFTLYCDVIDLIMEYFMKTIGYDQQIEKMCNIYNAIVK